MRDDFVEALIELADEDERVVLVTGDLGFSVLEPFSDRFPDRFYNAGVAEQNMVGMATGLADAGFVPFLWSIATFASMRPYEFIRNGPALHRLPVRIVGTGGGFEYGKNGVTHYALEDVGILRLQPDVTIVVPADRSQVGTAMRQISETTNPTYFRIGKEQRIVEGLEGRFELGRAMTIGEGSDVAIVAMGPVARDAVIASELLAKQSVAARVEVVSSFNPSPERDLATSLSRTSLAVTAEAHYATGALGSLVAEVIAENGLGCRLVRCGVREMPRGHVGTDSYLRDLHRISAEHIASAALRALAA